MEFWLWNPWGGRQFLALRRRMQNSLFLGCIGTHTVVSRGRHGCESRPGSQTSGTQIPPRLWGQHWPCPAPAMQQEGKPPGCFWTHLPFFFDTGLCHWACPGALWFCCLATKLVSTEGCSQESRLTQAAPSCWGLVVVNTLLKEQRDLKIIYLLTTVLSCRSSLYTQKYLTALKC